MLHNVMYNKIKLAYRLSRLVWFIEKHGIDDAKTAGDEECIELMQNLKRDLQSYMEELEACLKEQDCECEEELDHENEDVNNE